MNELATEEMQSSKNPIGQEASDCPLQAMPTQRTVLDADDELVFPKHKRVVAEYSTGCDRDDRWRGRFPLSGCRCHGVGTYRAPAALNQTGGSLLRAGVRGWSGWAWWSPAMARCPRWPTPNPATGPTSSQFAAMIDLLVARYTAVATAVPDDATAAGTAESQMTAVVDAGQNSHVNFAHLAAAPRRRYDAPRARPSG